ncbi:MAG: hypothetical protein ABI573_00780 [Chloroflexota bacterium]
MFQAWYAAGTTVRVGPSLGLLTPALFSVVLVAVVLTTVVAPVLLSLTIPRAIAEDAARRR